MLVQNNLYCFINGMASPYRNAVNKIYFGSQKETPSELKEKKDEESNKDLILKIIVALGSVVGINFINEKLQNQLRKYITNPILNREHVMDEKYILDLAKKMGEKNGLTGDKEIEIIMDPDTSSRTAGFIEKHKIDMPEIKGGAIGISQKELISIFHEMGHAIIENKKFLLKHLQRFRGEYAYVASFLYAIANHKPKRNEDLNLNEQKDKTKSSSYKNARYLIPFIAFAPELITEIKASKYGLKFLKEEKVGPKLIGAAKKHYLAAFATYLFVPTSIVITDKLYNFINEKFQKGNK